MWFLINYCFASIDELDLFKGFVGFFIWSGPMGALLFLVAKIWSIIAKYADIIGNKMETNKRFNFKWMEKKKEILNEYIIVYY